MISTVHKLIVFNSKSKISLLFSLFGALIVCKNTLFLIKFFLDKYNKSRETPRVLKVISLSQQALIEGPDEDLSVYFGKLRSAQDRVTHILYNGAKNSPLLKSNFNIPEREKIFYINKNLDDMPDFRLKYQCLAECVPKEEIDSVIFNDKNSFEKEALEHNYHELGKILDESLTSKLSLITSLLEKPSRILNVYYFLDKKSVETKELSPCSVSSFLVSSLFQELNITLEKTDYKLSTKTIIYQTDQNLSDGTYKFSLVHPKDRDALFHSRPVIFHKCLKVFGINED